MTGDDDDYLLCWPQDLFKAEAARLLDGHRGMSGWIEACELLLEDAFEDAAPRDAFSAVVRAAGSESWSAGSGSRPAWLDAGQEFMASLQHRSDLLRAGPKVPYYSHRRLGGAGGSLAPRAAAAEFGRLVGDLEGRGYFERAFGKDCVDAPNAIDPAQVMAAELGVDGLWPLRAVRLADDLELFFDVIEVLHDLAAAPRSRWWHSFSDCGYHHDDFSSSLGRAVYRWRVNRILDRSDLGYRLAEAGEERGRLVATTDEARAELARRMAERTEAGGADAVRHALALFRGRSAGVEDKRSACIALAGVLEERRAVLKGDLLKGDEGALFQIANSFSIRHRDAGQKADYDPVFLDWVFWWYLATIELSDRLLARDASRDA